MNFVLSAIVALGLIILGGATFIVSGGYNVAATEPHAGLTQWILNTAMARSVSIRAREVSAPTQFTQEQVQSGFSEFNEMCVTCHGAPGREKGEVGKGLNPPPPDLAEHADHWANAELFWIVKHGIKMTGMPAFGPTHSDDQLWTIVAFVKMLPQLSSEGYEKMKKTSGDVREHPGGGEHDNDHKH
jgi:mono/diheme cytochrome c family protein